MASDEISKSLEDEDWNVLALYGRAMLSAQLLEFSIFDLARWERPTPKDADRALLQLERLLRQPKRDQAKNLAALGDELRDNLLLALETRNMLGHTFLMEYRIDAAVMPDVAGKVEARLMNITEYFDQVRAELDALSSGQQERAGIEVTEEDREAIEESLRRYVGEKYESE